MKNHVLLFVIFSAFLFSCGNENKQRVSTPEENGEVQEEAREMAAIEDTIEVYRPRPGERIESPFEIEGIARGHWFFEAAFAIRLLDENEKEIAVAVAEARDDWMTDGWVDFSANLDFETPDSKEGFLLFEKANPSGLEEYERELRLPVRFE